MLKSGSLSVETLKSGYFYRVIIATPPPLLSNLGYPCNHHPPLNFCRVWRVYMSNTPVIAMYKLRLMI